MGKGLSRIGRVKGGEPLSNLGLRDASAPHLVSGVARDGESAAEIYRVLSLPQSAGSVISHPLRFSRRALLQLGAAGVALRAVVRSRVAGAQGPPLPDSVLPRAAWGAAPAGAGMRLHRIERITVHHTGPPAWYGTTPATAYLRVIQAFHTGPERRWPDIAYHLLIDLDGIVWEGRPLAFAGDSATEYDPTGHALVAVLGDYDLQRPNASQLDALAACVAWLREAYALADAPVRGHRDYAATACPGAFLVPLLGSLQTRAG
jgi:hypothetical protein